MKKEIVIAGFGGQGVMSIGKSLVEAGLEEGLEVSWVPSYGPEMRGGTANCSVIMSVSLWLPHRLSPHGADCHERPFLEEV